MQNGLTMAHCQSVVLAAISSIIPRVLTTVRICGGVRSEVFCVRSYGDLLLPMFCGWVARKSSS